MAHDVFDVVAEDPEVQHVADQVHPTAVQKHAGQHRRERRHCRDLGRERGVAEDDGGDGAILIHKGFAGSRGQRTLVEEHEATGGDEGDGDDRCVFGRVIVSEGQHGDPYRGGALRRRSRKSGIGRERTVGLQRDGETGRMRMASAAE